MLSMPAPLSMIAAPSPVFSAEPRPRAVEPGQSAPEPDGGAGDLAGEADERIDERIDDRWVRAVGIPAFGLGIPRVTDLLAGVSIDQPSYWIGTIAFIALAA